MTPKEERMLKRSAEILRQRYSRLSKTAPILFLTLFGFFVTTTLLATLRDRNGPPKYFYVLIALLVSTLISAVSYPSLSRDRQTCLARLRAHEAAISGNEVHVTRVRSDEMVEFEEVDDEGACYAFQVDGPRIVFLNGQEYYPSAKFPNSDFSLVDIYGPDGSVLEEWIEKTGSKLRPVRKIPRKLKWQMEVPAHMQVIEGRIADLENLLSKKQRRL
jgi:hypothetical protein